MSDAANLRQHAWVKAFMPEPEMQQLFIGTQVVREIIISQAIRYIKAYKDLYAKCQGSTQEFKVGIIGLGQIGKMLLLQLVNLDLVSPGQIVASTRNWEKHSSLNEEGIAIFHDNARVAAECDVVVMCCLPYHAETVCTEIKGALQIKNQSIFSFTGTTKPKSLVISSLAAYPVSRIQQLLGNFSNVFPIVLKTSDIMNDVIRLNFDDGVSAAKQLSRNTERYVVEGGYTLEMVSGASVELRLE
mmetsp:Transcript_24168/g.42945  ORF Transcript_24168/g.42945 Transcript_24168/m.42945 type:complete len:244 (-) Transcript_24168:2-733(-)